jgi:hypothetical protein
MYVYDGTERKRPQQDKQDSGSRDEKVQDNDDDDDDSFGLFVGTGSLVLGYYHHSSDFVMVQR